MVVLLILAITTSSYSNNISITNGIVTGQNTVSKYTLVQFDISWENSWRTSTAPINWDAAWVFVKFRIPVAKGGDGLWKQTSLNNSGHTAPAGSTLDVGLLTPGSSFDASTNPGIGVFLYRSADGSGTFSKTGVQLRWNYGNNNVGDNDVIEILIFAIEMAQVPTGTFSVGSGGTESGSFTDGSWTSGATIPFSIASEGALGIDNAAGKLWGTSTSTENTIGNVASDAEATLPAAFPKGYVAFYCMKYEISQQGYVDFLNTLTYSQQTTRTANAPNSVAGTAALITGNGDRNGIDVMTPGVSTSTPAIYACNLNGNSTYGEAADGQNIACNYLEWADLAAYLDWSGLRPMTELEFEKACRGTIAPVADEYAWGTATVTSNAYTLSNAGAGNEVIGTYYSTTVGNAIYYSTIGSINGPLRVGIFAGTSGSTGRITAGATYYGTMEMSGNLWERIVTIGDNTGRSFTGTHGNGALDTNGNADATTWPGTDAIGSGYRGSSYGDDPSYMHVSDRALAVAYDDSRYYNYGGRGVRSAP